MQHKLKSNLVNSHSPEDATCAAILPSFLPACLSLNVMRALISEAVKVDTEKGIFKL